MEKILCLPHQLVFISQDAADVPISVVLWDSSGTDVIIDGAVVFSGTVLGADAIQSALFWVNANYSGSLSTVVGGLLRVLPSAGGAGLAIAFTGGDLSGASTRGVSDSLYAATATDLTGSPIVLSPGDQIVFGRERTITPAGGVGGAAAGSSSGTSALDVIAGVSGTQAVSTTVLRVLGATNWTLATANGAQKRIVQVTNCSTGDDLFLKSIALATATAGAVSATDYDVKVAPGAVVSILLLAGQDLACLRSSGSDNVRAKEFITV